jgi:ribosomal peptide maturation radical SAM protein 1
VATSQSRVLLVCMPWANPEYPSLALGLLKACLEQDGLACDNLYASLRFLRQLGDLNFYRTLGYAAEGDVVFTPRYFGSPVDEAAATLHGRTGRIFAPLGQLARCREVIEAGERFIDDLYQSVDWGRYDIVGFSLMFQQLLASLSLARLIKASHPRTAILFGGPSCDDCMGLEMIRSFPEVDYVAIGEADQTLPALVREIRTRAAGSQEPIQTPGVAFRGPDGAVQHSKAVEMTIRLDDLPYPDYGPYFEQLARLDLESAIDPVLYMEGSRGCWWGQKSLCTFCGLNGTTISFRAKTPARVIEEAKALSAKYGISRFWTSDNILDHRAYRSLLPALRDLRVKEGWDLSFFFEIKSNVTKEQVKALRDAGVTWVQPGIESFSDHILALMHKGAEAIQQIQLLKYLAEFSMRVDWNILYANPNEHADDYRQMAALVPFLHHLPPPAPGTVVPMNLQRFTRYHSDPAGHGITWMGPGEFYRRVFPREDIDLHRLVYYFDYVHPDQSNTELQAARQLFFDAVAVWRRVYRAESLIYRRGPGSVTIVDRRVSPAETTVLTGAEAALYVACDSARGGGQIRRDFESALGADGVAAFLSSMVSRRLMYRSPADKFLSLALQDQTGRGLQFQRAIARAVEPPKIPAVPPRAKGQPIVLQVVNAR